MCSSLFKWLRLPVSSERCTRDRFGSGSHSTMRRCGQHELGALLSARQPIRHKARRESCARGHALDESLGHLRQAANGDNG